MTQVQRLVWIAVGLAVLVLAYFAYTSLRQSQDDRVRMQQTLTLLNAQIKESQERAHANAQVLQDQIDEMRKERAAVKTPQQAASAIPQVIPGVQPIIIQLPTAARPGGETVTGSPETTAPAPRAEIPLEQLTTLYNFAMDCKECGVKLTAAEKDKIELTVQTKLLTQERNEAVKAVRGGTFWQKFGRTMKTVGITAAIVVPVAFLAGRSNK